MALFIYTMYRKKADCLKDAILPILAMWRSYIQLT